MQRRKISGKHSRVNGIAFREAFEGEWDSEEAYAEHMFNEYYASSIPNNLQMYFDYKSFTRDLFMCDYFSIERKEEGGVFVFRNI
jgi:antirestriction protein